MRSMITNARTNIRIDRPINGAKASTIWTERMSLLALEMI